MFFDIGWPELLLIGLVALVVIGPKDLPRALRIAGFWVRKARTLSREFQSSIDQMIREAELEEVREELKKATEFDIEKEIRQTVDPTGDLAESIKPPAIPDYFDEAPGPSEPAGAVPALAAPAESALLDAPAGVESMPEPADLQPSAAPEPSSATTEPADSGPAAAPKPEPKSEPAAPKP